MADQDYDDALLVVSENLATVDWETLDSGGKLSVSNDPHLCVVKKVGGYLHNFQDYTGPRAKVMLQVVSGPDKGKTQHDDITLPHPQESQGSQNRRVLIGTRMGLMQKGSKETSKINWKLLEGKQVLISGEDSVSKKNGKMYYNVAFDGWQDPAAAPAAPAGASPAEGSKDAYSDI